VLSVERASSNTLHATVHTAHTELLPIVEQQLRRLFDLDTDPRQVAAHLARDPLFLSVIERQPGLRVPGAWDGLELCVRAILGQQITVQAATALCTQLVQSHGVPLPRQLAQSHVTHLFPSAQQLAVADLSMLKMPGARRSALTTLANAVRETPHVLAARETLPDTIRALCTLRGIGPWTAHYIALRWLREADAFPEGDVALLRALGLLLNRPVNARELVAYVEQFRPYRAYAVLHLWSSLAHAPERTQPKRTRLKPQSGAS
jgi:3-methyladenine DNA glycosylase/8-oxoguanine DNA glycosylase